MNEKKIHNIVYGSAWRNCYWFARMLLNTDQYGAPGKNEKFMNLLLSDLEPLMILEKFSEGESKSAFQRKFFRDEVESEI